MGMRLRIAVTIWLVTMLLAVPAAMLTLLVVLMTTGFSRQGQSVLPPLLVALVPPAVAALATRLMSAYASSESAQAMQAGPIVLGSAAGLAAGGVIGSVGSVAGALLGMGIFSAAGAVAGSFVGWPLRARTVGIAIAIVTVGAVLLMLWTTRV
jgi:hypothetical protein